MLAGTQRSVRAYGCIVLDVKHALCGAYHEETWESRHADLKNTVSLSLVRDMTLRRGLGQPHTNSRGLKSSS